MVIVERHTCGLESNREALRLQGGTGGVSVQPSGSVPSGSSRNLRLVSPDFDATASNGSNQFAQMRRVRDGY